jgi:ABC transporter substrate binding protein
MRRRDFITLLGGSATWPLAARAQPAGKVYRVGLVFTGAPISDVAAPDPTRPLLSAFVQGMRSFGYVDGQNLILQRRSAEGRVERLGDIIAELVRLQVDVIVTVSTPTARAAKAVTTTVPVVMATSADSRSSAALTPKRSSYRGLLPHSTSSWTSQHEIGCQARSSSGSLSNAAG